jgi:hypothetical protein
MSGRFNGLSRSHGDGGVLLQNHSGTVFLLTGRVRKNCGQTQTQTQTQAQEKQPLYARSLPSATDASRAASAASAAPASAVPKP